MRTRLTLAAGTAVLALVGSVFAAAPVNAQTVNFELTAGALSIAEPVGAATLTASNPLAGLTGATVDGPLGVTVVTDDRAGVAGWASKITGTTDFTNGDTTIPVTAAKAYVPGAITTTGTSTVSAGLYVAAATGLSLSNAAQTLVSATVVVGNNTATFNPSLTVAIPGNATAGVYSGVVTQTIL